MDTRQDQRQSLLAKIADLMDYRMLPDLIGLVENCQSKKEILIKGLVDLQVAIYDLDHYLETNWVLSQTSLDQHWQPIYESLTALGVEQQHHQDFVSHILKYQKHEMQLRDLVLPTRFDMQYFYFYKSCDVKLLRRIIMMHYPQLAKMYSAADWRVFDLITEVDDDVEDVLEDRETINGNRYLISIWQYGFEKTQHDYLHFLEIVERMMMDRFGRESTRYHSDLLGWSQEVLDGTRRRILTTTLPNLDVQGLWLTDRVPRRATTMI